MTANSSAAGYVTVVGTLNVDHVWRVPRIPRPGETVLADAVERQFGGKGANQAIAAARQGCRVRMIGAVGDDADGACYRERLASEGVVVDHLHTAEGVATGTAHVYVDPHGENLIVVDRGANARLDEDKVRFALDRTLHDTTILLLQLETPRDAVLAALRMAEAADVRSLLNASPAARDFPWGEIAIDTVIVNESECRESFGFAADDLGRLDSAGRVQLCGCLKVSHVIVTRGSRATLHLSPTGVSHVPTFPVTPRDTVGAGDTFAGVLASRLAACMPREQAIREANVAAALSTLSSGAQPGMPTNATVALTLASAPPSAG
ncbi:MAG TPA: ribokinase [Candidatus Synoicihabitans sp.]|nr:ribokinase [Candidatus Synoicihabitans sp.]